MAPRRPARILAAAAIAVAGFTLPAPADSLTYENARFGTRLTFPAELFETRLEPPDNSDGMTWTNADGASLAVYGSHNVTAATPAELLAQARRDMAGVAYSASGDDWVVVSGVDGATVYYQRWVFGADDVMHAVLLRYPVARKSDYDHLVGPIAGSLRGQ